MYPKELEYPPTISRAVTRLPRIPSNADAAGNALASNIRHLPFGPVKSLTYGNGLALARTHDLNYRRTAQTVGATPLVQSLAYSYDPAGNLHSVTDALAPARNETYGYDEGDRLTAAQGGYGNLAYSYGATGDRTADWRGGAETRYAYDLASQRLQSLSGAKTDAYTYDPTGNLTQAGGRQLAYDPDGRLAAVRQNGADLARYTYDPQGRRTGKLGGGFWANYAYGPDGGLLAENGSPNTQSPATYADLDGEPLARVDYDLSDWTGSRVAQWNVLYYHNTPLGTPHTATNPGKQTVWQAAAEPFGQAAAPGSAQQNLRFPGQFFDAETGFHYNMARYYHPGLGRYLQSDPIGLAGGVNTYGYVGGIH